MSPSQFQLLLAATHNLSKNIPWAVNIDEADSILSFEQSEQLFGCISPSQLPELASELAKSGVKLESSYALIDEWDHRDYEAVAALLPITPRFALQEFETRKVAVRNLAAKAILLNQHDLAKRLVAHYQDPVKGATLVLRSVAGAAREADLQTVLPAIQWLIEAGADPNEGDWRSSPALEKALTASLSAELSNALIQDGARFDTFQTPMPKVIACVLASSIKPYDAENIKRISDEGWKLLEHALVAGLKPPQILNKFGHYFEGTNKFSDRLDPLDVAHFQSLVQNVLLKNNAPDACTSRPKVRL